MTSGTGTCSVKYDQAGSANYSAAPQVVESVTAQKASQAITVTTHAPASAVFGASFGVAANAPGGVVTFSSGGACSNSGSTFTMTSGTGTCSVWYDQGGNANYSAAPQVVESVTAQKASQSISVTTHAPASAVFGASFGWRRTAPGGAVTFSSARRLLERRRDVHDDERQRTCSVRYDQAGGANYNAAPQVVESVSGGEGEPGDHGDDARAGERGRSAPSFSVAATAPGGAVTFSSSGAARTSGATFTMTSASGTCRCCTTRRGARTTTRRRRSSSR